MGKDTYNTVTLALDARPAGVCSQWQLSRSTERRGFSPMPPATNRRWRSTRPVSRCKEYLMALSGEGLIQANKQATAYHTSPPTRSWRLSPTAACWPSHRAGACGTIGRLTASSRLGNWCGAEHMEKPPTVSMEGIKTSTHWRGVHA